MCKQVSVIIVTFNRLHFFKAALDSALSQSYSNIELIISDDASDDFNTNMERFLGSPLEGYIAAKKRANIKNVIINQNAANIGTVNNIRTAVDSSHGDYIFVFSGDDALHNDEVIEQMVNEIRQNQYDVLSGRHALCDENLRPVSAGQHDDWIMDFVNSHHREELLYVHLFSVQLFGTLMHTRNIYEKLRFYDSPLYLIEDLHRNIKLLRSDAKIGFSRAWCVKYRAAEGSVVRSKDKNVQRVFELERLITVNMDLKPELKRYEKMFLEIPKDKKIIVWGTGDAFQLAYPYLIQHFPNIAYIIDNDEKKHNQIINGLNIYPVETVLQENKEDIFIVVCSSFYFSGIRPWLIEHSFEEGWHMIPYSRYYTKFKLFEINT